MSETGSTSVLRKDGQTNKIISIQCNSWKEPGGERFGAKVLKPEKEDEDRDGKQAVEEEETIYIFG